MLCMPPQIASVGMWFRMANRTKSNSKLERRLATTGKVYRFFSPYRVGSKSGPLPVRRSPSTPSSRRRRADRFATSGRLRRESTRRKNHRHAAEFLNGADIPGPQKICGLLAAPFLTITGIEVGGDSDDGFHASGSVPKAAALVLAGCNRRPLAQAPLRRRGSGWVYRP